MYPYDENNNTPSGGNNNEQRCDAPAEDGSYRIVKPDAEQNTCYRDAAYTPQSGASFDGYYVPGGRGGKPPEPEKKPHKRGMGAALAQVVRGQLGLGALAVAVQTFKNDEFTHSGVPPF